MLIYKYVHLVRIFEMSNVIWTGHVTRMEYMKNARVHPI
jgi:hypothetical protein